MLAWSRCSQITAMRTLGFFVRWLLVKRKSTIKKYCWRNFLSGHTLDLVNNSFYTHFHGKNLSNLRFLLSAVVTFHFFLLFSGLPTSPTCITFIFPSADTMNSSKWRGPIYKDDCPNTFLNSSSMSLQSAVLCVHDLVAILRFRGRLYQCFYRIEPWNLFWEGV